MQIEAAAASTYHLSACPQIEFEGPDRAHVECYGLAGGRSAEATQIYGGRYFHIFGAARRRLEERQLHLCARLDRQAAGRQQCGGALVGINRVTDRSPGNPLFRRMGIDATG